MNFFLNATFMYKILNITFMYITLNYFIIDKNYLNFTKLTSFCPVLFSIQLLKLSRLEV